MKGPNFRWTIETFLLVAVSITIYRPRSRSIDGGGRSIDPPRVSNVSPKKVCSWWLRAAQLSHQLEDSGTNMYHRFMGSMILAKSLESSLIPEQPL